MVLPFPTFGGERAAVLRDDPPLKRNARPEE